MSFKQKQIARLPNQRDGISQLPSVSVAGVGLDILPLQPFVARLRLDEVELAIDEGDDYGSVKLCDLPDSNLHLLGVELDLTVVKGGETGGLVAATDLDMGVGTAAASNSTLATTMIDIVEKVDLNDDALSVDLEVHTLGQSTATMPKQIADAADSALYLNAAAAITTSDVLTISGEVYIYLIDLGNYTS